MRIVFVIPNMTGGGAARVASILCGEWAAAGHEVHFVTFEEPGAKSLYALDTRIRRHQIGLAASGAGLVSFAATNIRRVARVRSLLKSTAPAAAFAFLLEANSATALAGLGLDVPIVVSERNHPGHDPISALRACIRAFAYRRATGVVVQTEDIARWFERNLGLTPSIIANPVVLSTGVARQVPDGGRRTVVSLGRLESQKGYDLLIDAFATIAADIPDWDLTVYGEGGQRAALEQAVRERGLEGRVFFPGVTTEPGAALAAADLYVQPSRYEGYPNALIEALAAGLCALATDCPGASRELLGDGQYGVLTPNGDVFALAEGLRALARDEKRRRAFASAARLAIKKLGSAEIAQRWLDLFAAESLKDR